MANEAVAGFVVRRAGAADPDDAVDTDDASSRAEASRGLAVEEDHRHEFPLLPRFS